MISPLFIELADEFDLHLAAQRKSKRTIDAYMESVKRFTVWASKHKIKSPGDVTRKHIRQWLVDLQDEVSPQTAVRHYSGVRQWFKYLADDEDITEVKINPTEGVPQPKVPKKLPPVPPIDAIKAILEVCDKTEGRDFTAVFTARRDAALIHIMASGGPRASEVIGMTVDDVDIKAKRITIKEGKGGKERRVSISDKAAMALHRYQRVRRQHPHAERPELWLGVTAGRSGTRSRTLTTSGIRQILIRRSEDAGLEKALHPHALRHYFADTYLRRGGSENELMWLMGWDSRQMVDRYAAANGADRAAEAYRRLRVGDEL